MAIEVEVNWHRVTHRTPCPVCERPDWCTVSHDGRYVHCMRVESVQAAKGDAGGWIHRLDNGPMYHVAPSPKMPVPRLPLPEIKRLAIAMYRDWRAKEYVSALANQLGVTFDSLDRLRVGYGRDDHSGGSFWSFPSRDSHGRIIGITRRYINGVKRTYPGTTNGLFFAREALSDPGPLFLPEGGSDVAAFLSAGLCAIGRPSNCGGINLLRPIVNHELRRGRTVIVVGERDEQPEKRGGIPSCPKDCGGCGHCFPGIQAKRLAASLGCQFVLPPAGLKDFREYFKRGAVWSELLSVIGNPKR